MLKKRFQQLIIMLLIISILGGCSTTSNNTDVSIRKYNNSVVDIDENIEQLITEDNIDDADSSNNDDVIYEDNSSENLGEEDEKGNVEDVSESVISDSSMLSENFIDQENVNDESGVLDDNEIIEEEKGEEGDDREDEVHNDEKNSMNLSLHYCKRTNGNIVFIPESEMIWDATVNSTDSYSIELEKEIILQINYEKSDTETIYDAGELVIKVPNLFYGCESSQLETSVSFTANTESQNLGYDWNCISSANPSNKDEYFEFSNVDEISTSLTGSIQIGYVVKSLGDNGKENGYHKIMYYPEVYENFCEENFSSDTSATLTISTNDEVIETEKLSFDYNRTYSHPWQRQQFTINTTVERARTTAVNNINDYICLKYTYYIPEGDLGRINDASSYNSTYPYYFNIHAKLITDFPEDCIIVDDTGKILENSHYEKEYNFTYKDPIRHMLGIQPIYVLYPRDTFNLENNNYKQINNVDLWTETEYPNDTGKLYAFNANRKIEVNLGEFATLWPEDGGGGLWVGLYDLSPELDTGRGEHRKYYSDLLRASYNRNEREYFRENQMICNVPFKDTIRNTTTDVYIGVDKIFVTGSDNEYRLLKDDEYFISCIRFPNYLYDAYNNLIPANTYTIELWVRYANENEYTLYDTTKNVCNTASYYTPILDWDYISPKNKKSVVGYYFKIKDVKNGIIYTKTGSTTESQVFYFYLHDADVADYGMIWPFSYIDAIDKNGHSYLDQTINEYEEFARLLLAPIDLEEYGYYMGRGCDGIPFNSIREIKFTNKLSVKKEMIKEYQNEKEEKFYGNATIHLSKGTNIGQQYERYYTHLSIIPDEQKFKGFECWDLLPYGMELESTEEEIKSSINDTPLKKNFDIYWNNAVTYSFAQKFKDYCDIEIIENYNSTGRTMLHIKFDFGDNTAVFSTIASYADLDYLTFNYNFSISYDAYMENSTYTNYIYADWVTNKFLLQNVVQDNGSIDKDAIDINLNGNVNEQLAYGSSVITLTDMVSSQQGLSKKVQTDKNNFKSGIAESSLDTDYYYKLILKTGATLMTDLVIYDNIEESYGNNEYWKGEFIDVDTSYAESKGYVVKVYYSENLNASSLDNEDDCWEEYTEDVDKTKVKSLAFEYFDKDGNKAVFPVNTMTYVIIKMHSPIVANFNKTYNSAKANYLAINEMGNIIPGLEALPSNTVSVVLSSSDVMMPFTGGNGNIWIYIITTFTTIIGFALLYIAKRYKQKEKL